MYGGENSGMPLGPDPVNSGTGTFGADDNYDQPAAIVSGGEDGGAVAFDSSNKSNNNNNNSAKFFGRRSRESATRADAGQTQANAELAAANSIASNPNNPEFFRQAAAENATSQIQRQPRQINKKPFIIVGALILVAVIGFAIYSIIPKPTQEEKNTELAKIIKENMDGYIHFEALLSRVNDENIRLSNFIYVDDAKYDEMKNENAGSLEKVKKIESALGDFKYAGADNVKEAKDLLSERIAQYEKYNKITLDIIDSMRSDNADTIQSNLSEYSSLPGMDTSIKLIKQNAPSSVKTKSIIVNNGCKENPDNATCYTALVESSRISESYRNSPILNNAIKTYVGEKKDGRLTDLLNQLTEEFHEGGGQK